MLGVFSKVVDSMLGNYSLPDVLERMCHNQLALETEIMELTLWVEQNISQAVGGNVHGALDTIGENAGHIKQGLVKLKSSSID